MAVETRGKGASSSMKLFYKGSHSSWFSQSDALDASQMSRSSSIDIEGLRDKEHASAVLSTIPKFAEVRRHRAHVVRNEHAPLFRRQREDLQVLHLP